MACHSGHSGRSSWSVLSGAGACRVRPLLLAATAVLLSRVCVSARAEAGAKSQCARLESGWACGVQRRSTNNSSFVSFLGVPYARQPLGHLRFQELQQVESWSGIYNATREGPICPQRDVFYGRIMRPQNKEFTEACIHANVHVPLHALPERVSEGQHRSRRFQPPQKVVLDDEQGDGSPGSGLPILVFVHGGGFGFGSGDTDLYGPEYLMNHDVIVVTFNYRLNVFGFLSLNNSYVPGNNGLRDIVTLLRWVQLNARAFGGNPRDVTLAGHSAGAASAHLLTLSEATKGLFKRSMIMSGTAIPTFYTTTPSYAQFVSKMFLEGLGIKSTDPKEVHQQLIDVSLERIMQVYDSMLDQFGLIVFFPVVESSAYPNFTTILDDDPETLINKGRGKDIPLIVGFTDAECYGFLPRFEQIDILARLKMNLLLLTPPQLIYKRSPEVALKIARKVRDRYFHGEPTMEEYVKYCSESNFIYPAMKVARDRAVAGGAPVYLYEFSYETQFSIKKMVDNTTYKGAGHMDDLTYVFRVNSILDRDINRPMEEKLEEWMVHFVINFIKYSDPAADEYPSFATPWPAFTKRDMKYQDINGSYYRTLELDSQQQDMLNFFDNLGNRTS